MRTLFALMQIFLAIFMAKNNIYQRIKDLRLQKKMSQEEFSSKIGISRSLYSHIEIGKSNPTIEQLIAIANTFRISYEYLLEGVSMSGEKYSHVSPNVSPNVSPISKSALLGDTISIIADPPGHYQSTKRVPILDQRAYAGSPGGFADQQGEDLQYISLPNLPSARTLIGIEVYGESMSPTILEGDILVCAQILKPLEIKHLGIYVICMLHDGASVKRYFGPEEDYLLFKSDNPQHSSLKVIPDESIQLWEVLYRVTGSFPQRTELSPDWMHQVDSNIAELKRSLKALQTPKK